MEPAALPLGLEWRLWRRAHEDHRTLFYISISLAKAEPWERAHTKTLSFDTGLAAESTGEVGLAPSWMLPRKGGKSQYFAVFYFSLTVPSIFIRFHLMGHGMELSW